MTREPSFENLNDRIRRIVREELARIDANGLVPEDYPRLARDLQEGRLSAIDFGEDMLLAIARRGAQGDGLRGPDAH